METILDKCKSAYDRGQNNLNGNYQIVDANSERHLL